MDSSRHPNTSAPSTPDLGTLGRSSPRTRQRLSAPAMRAFFALVAKWDLSTSQAQGLLGWVSTSTLHKYKSRRKIGTLSYDQLTRISLCLGIYKALHMLFAEAQIADQWVMLPNSNAIFGDQPPLALMIHGGIDGLHQVRRLLDAASCGIQPQESCSDENLNGPGSQEPCGPWP